MYSKTYVCSARYIHWLLVERCEFDRTTNLCEQKPDGVAEKQDLKVQWGFIIQCIASVRQGGPALLLLITDIVIPGGSRFKDKEQEELKNYELFKEELKSSHYVL